MHEKEPLPNIERETFKEIHLEVKDPDGVHRIEIIFDVDDVGLISSYNAAINEICNDKEKLGMFHQTGRGNDPGYHAWEVLGAKMDTQKLEQLLPDIHIKAKEFYPKFKKLGLF